MNVTVNGHGRAGRNERVICAAAAILFASAVLSACDPGPPPPMTSSTSPTAPPSSPGSPGAPPADREALYEYCDRAVGQDPACYTTRFGNDLRAADEALTGPEWFGGIGETTATPQGLTALPVGTTLDLVENEFSSLELSDSDAAGSRCTMRVDSNARFGVVTRPSASPRGELDAVEAFLIGNPVIRTSDDLGMYSTLQEVRRAYPDVQLAKQGGVRYAVTRPEPASETLYSSSSERLIRFELDSGDVVRGWSVGSPDFVDGC